MKKYVHKISLGFILLFLNSCIILDVVKFPVFSNPTGAVVKAEILETSNFLTKFGYLVYFSTQPGGGNIASVLTEASMTDVFVLQLLNLDDEKFYDRDTVDECKDFISISIALMPSILNPMTASEVTNSINDNFLIAYSLTHLCKIDDGKLIYDSGNGGI